MKRLKILRVIANKTQRELAKEVGCSQSLISLFESGKVIPGKHLRESIAEALDAPKDDLFPIQEI